MALVPVSETENDSVWVCPMPECGTVQDKPGVCPVCNMNLTRYEPVTDEGKTAEMSAEAHDHEDHAEAPEGGGSEDPYNIHTCPMPEHFHVLNYGPGDCPECGMALVPVSETENDSVWVCPMPECGTAQDEPGVCPVCNMNLIEYQSGESHDH
jgi:rubrerythrin